MTEPSVRARVSRRLGPGGLTAVFAVYLAISVAITWPMARDIGTLVVGDPGDPVLNASILLWSATTPPFSARWWNAPHYYPAEGVGAFTENLVGISPLATPAYWLTGNPILAYNLALFLTWPLSALAVFLLVRYLGGNDDAAWLAGLSYAFTPIRAPGIGHIQTLAAYGFPLLLLALHGFLTSGRRTWLLLAGAAWLQQSLANGYFMLFGAVLIAAWLAYFCSTRHALARGLTAIGALAVASIPLVPVMLGYWQVHERYGLHRTLAEITYFSATTGSWLEVSPLVSMWTWVFHEGKDNLFPGATAVTIALLGAAMLVSQPRAPAGSSFVQLRRIRLALAVASAAALGALMVRVFAGPIDTTLFSIPIRMRSADRALALVVLTGVPLMLLLSANLRSALARRSPLVFYATATIVLAVLCFGPVLRAGDDVILSRAPYAWLMALPGFNELRIPTQFKIPAVLCLSIAVGLAYPILRPSAARLRVALLLLVTAGLVADGWLASVPMALPPASWSAAEPGDRAEPILELPLGPAWDAAATFRAAIHRRRVFNGVSGYEPPHYYALETGLRARDPEMLTAMASLGPFDVVVNRVEDPDGALARYAAGAAGAIRVRDGERQLVYRVPPTAAEPELGDALPITRIASTRFEEDAPLMHDARIETGWTNHPYAPGARLTIDLGAIRDVGAITHATGDFARNFPAALQIDVSADGRTWEPAWEGSIAAKAFLAYVREPRSGRLRIAFPARPARYVRLRQTADDDRVWRVSEITVHAPPLGQAR